MVARVVQIVLHVTDFQRSFLKVVDSYKKQCSDFFFKIFISYAPSPLYRFNFLLILAFGHNFWTIGDRDFFLVLMDC